MLMKRHVVQGRTYADILPEDPEFKDCQTNNRTGPFCFKAGMSDNYLDDSGYGYNREGDKLPFMQVLMLKILLFGYYMYILIY